MKSQDNISEKKGEPKLIQTRECLLYQQSPLLPNQIGCRFYLNVLVLYAYIYTVIIQWV